MKKVTYRKPMFRRTKEFVIFMGKKYYVLEFYYQLERGERF